MSSAKVIENPEVPERTLQIGEDNKIASPVMQFSKAGLECFLPPPPPPPPPPTTSSTNNVATTTSPAQGQQQQQQQQKQQKQQKQQTTTTETKTSSTSSNPGSHQVGTFANSATPAPYILHPGVQPQTPAQPATPWWIPTDADTSDVYVPWYDTSYKTVVAAAAAATNTTAQATSAKTKNKYYKRKSESIDPAQDAEKVASAQKELSALMKPLKCDLCNAVMNSTLQAKLHYDGKPHQKKVSIFLNQSVKKQKTEDGQVTSTTTDWQNYCDICKTWFTSQMDATQHYAGKKHIRAASGGPRQRSKKHQNQYNQVDSTGRYGIGLAFQSDGKSVSSSTPTATAAAAATIVTATATATATDVGSATAPLYTAPPYPTPLRCDLCGVSANRQDQLETHKRGARHLRMLKLNGLPVPETASESESSSVSSGPIDYSIYRTPSGQYYCAPCNLSLNSESTFAQHMESKKHKTQSNPKSPSNAVVVAKKARFKKK